MGLIRLNPLLAKLDMLRVLGRYLVLSFGGRGIICLFQTDFKKVIAYSSIFHIRVIPVLILLPNSLSRKGILIMMLIHGLISPMLFILVGMSRKLLKTRIIILIQGMGLITPWILILVALGFLLNLPCPPFLSFLGEILFFIPALTEAPYFMPAIFIGMMISLLYNLNWAATRVCPTTYDATSPQIVSIGEQIRATFFVLSNILIIPFFRVI